MKTFYSEQTVERNGHKYRVEIEDDQDAGEPWENSDGHGIVSDWVMRDKKPGELLLNSSHPSKRFYDFAETMKLAKRDSWGLGADDLAALAEKLGHTPSAKEITAESVRRDYEYLRAWCNDDWRYVGVIVTDVTADESTMTDYGHAVWGVESNCDECIAEYVEEFISDMEAGYFEHEKQAAEERRKQNDIVTELAYIRGVPVGNPGKSFNDEPACFARYVLMQAKGAHDAGMCEQALKMLAHVVEYFAQSKGE